MGIRTKLENYVGNIVDKRIDHSKFNKEITHDIKEVINDRSFARKYINSFDNFYFSEKDKNDLLKFSIYYENNYWYLNHFKNNILKNMIKKINGKILDEYNIYEIVGNEDEIKKSFNLNINGNNYELVFTNEILEHLLTMNLLYGNCFLRLNYENDKPTIEIIEPFKVKQMNDAFYILGFDGKTPKYEKITKEAKEIYKYDFEAKEFFYESETRNILGSIGITGIFETNLKYEFINDATLEYILLFTLFDSLIAKEITGGGLTIFADKMYFQNGRFNSNIYNYELFSTPENIDLGVNEKKLFETIQNELRSGSIKEMEEMLKEKIASSLMLDKTTLGFSTETQTATATTIANATTIDMINLLKKQFKELMDKLLQEMFLTNDFYFQTNKYKINDYSTLLKNIQIGINSGSISIEKAVELLNEDLSKEEKEKEVILIKLEKGITLTPNQTQKAIELGLLTKSESDMIF